MKHMELSVNFKNVRNYSDIHKELKESLSFPAYYGENLDALYDMLTDMAGSDTVIVIKNFSRIAALSKEYSEKMTSVINAVKQFAGTIDSGFDIRVES